MSNNGASYQKTEGSSGSYQEIGGNGDGSSAAGGSGTIKKCLIAIGVVAILGIVYTVTSTRGDPQASVQKSIESSSTGLQVKANGKLKLFDDNSKSRFPRLSLFQTLLYLTALCCLCCFADRYVMEDYDAKSTFSSFLPGVAGYFGKPVWAFYVNRGQAMATFGTESKDYPMLEFNPANKAYQLTPFVGFRTFVRGVRGTTSFQTEPFAPAKTRNLEDGDDQADKTKPKRILYVGANELEIQEIDGVLGLTTNVQYFILPEEDFGSLIRRTTLSNSGDTDLTIDVLDGLAKMEPFGGPLDGMLKAMGRTLEGWMGVYHADDTLTMPFYKLSTEPSDSASVKIEESGHYCLSFYEDDEMQATLLPIVFDTSKVFGADTSLEMPRGLSSSSVDDILDTPQYGFAKTSSAFSAASDITLKPGENITIATVYGRAFHVDDVPKIAGVVTAPGFVKSKFERARSMINELTAGVETKTVKPLFDGTVKQMFLDNSLRGGIPTIMGLVDSDATYDEDSRVKVFHSFSRIHGDMERDYNAFKIDATYFSQGPGNYRDVAQNRRNDVTFFPRMGSFDIQMFLSYIQADGYEPLTVEAVVYRFADSDKAVEIAKNVTNDAKSAKMLGDVLNGGPFRPGQLFALCENLGINLAVTNEVFINRVLEYAEDRAMAVFGQGYWADHWDYYMDMIDAYLEIFPDVEEEVMYDKPLRYFFSTATVKPRSEKYVLTLTYDAKSKHVLQLDSTYYDSEKAEEQQAFLDQNTGLLGIEANWQRTREGEPFMSSAIAKLFLLGSIKFAMRDAWGMGVEYEGGRPGWLDSMNGLPGMVGSGMPETYELYLLLQYVKKVVDTYDRPVHIPVELHTMLSTMNDALDTLEKAGYVDTEDMPAAVPKALFEYWDIVAAARESYRNDVQYYFSGNTTAYRATTVSRMCDRWLGEIQKGIDRSFKVATEGYGDDGTSGIPATFFAYDITKWELNSNRNAEGLPLVNALAMKVRKFPLFLEGPVRYMKIIQDNKERMKDIYERVLDSGLRDKQLNMYFLSASLEGQTFDMGRQIAFAPGWLENQSIWLHMSYKYYLQLLRGKLYEEFFSEMKGGGILPFMDPDVYGRSLMECSSFIASSAFPDPSIVGEGFLARLSGSTAEFMDIWKLMFIGPDLFSYNDKGKVEMKLIPALPSWLFDDPDGDSEPTLDDDGNYVVSFKLFASIPVTYHNAGGKDLFGIGPKSYKVSMFDSKPLEIDGPAIPEKIAFKIRRMSGVKSIDAYF